MMRRFLAICVAGGFVSLWTPIVLAQAADTKKAEEKKAEPAPGEAKPAETQPAETKPAEAQPPETKPAEEAPPADKPAEGGEGATPAAEAEVKKEAPPAAPAEPEVLWPYQQPLFALYAKPQSHVRVGVGYATNPDVDSLGMFIEGSYAFSQFGVHIKMPLSYGMNEEVGNQFTFGDLELGVQWLISEEKESNKHLTVGLDIIAPLSRVGENKDLPGIAGGTVEDTSNFGKRFLLAQKPFLDIGLIPKLNMGFVPHVAFGQNIGRVSLQTDFGCLILIMDNVKETVYGIDRRLGFILFYDLAAPVAITKEFSIVSEFNAAVGLDGLLGTGFAITIGPRYTTSGFSVGAGIQLPIGVDNKLPDDDKMVGRFDGAILVRHQIAGILDLSYSF